MKQSRSETESLIRTYYALIPAAARRCFPRRAKDEDMLQCGLIGLWEASCRWNGQGKFAPYARRCILNNMKDYIRAEKRALPEAPFTRKPQPPGGKEENGDCRDLIRRIRSAWPAGSRERFALLALSRGMSLRETAAALGVNPITLRRIAARGVGRLGYSGDGSRKP